MPFSIPPEPYKASVAENFLTAAHIKWDPRPSDTAKNGVSWTEKSDDNAGNTPITGIYEDVLRDDHLHEVWAGILLGLALATSVGCVQSLFALRKRPELAFSAN